ncbi:TRAFAC clade GTPase domain-containing protein [Acinetobacter albensis]|uniref:Double-GTPase 2 domain-containing protein n=1 Tax=Acinetobacter albensis TaxID=1673609 RepID=A0A1C4GRS0_9GAMM|nr:hypothetical protein [Acinetobacter albensis]SCC70918.1 hypothetical protein GA0116959_1024 [Acinetobacter albensis]
MLYTCGRSECAVKNCLDNGDIPCLEGDAYEDCQYIKLINNENNLQEDNEANQVVEESEIDFKNILSSRGFIKSENIKFFGLEAEPSIATLIGLPNSGKTSLLTSMLYALRMDNEQQLSFMGSSTLNAWSNLINLTLYAHGNTPRHPERTIDRSETQYLHLLINKDDIGYDLLLGDTAGEIFSGIVENYDTESQEYKRIIKWISEVKTLLICLDSSDYYTADIWISKENHMIFIDRISEIIADFNPDVRVVFVQTKYDKVDENHNNFEYHKEVNDYFLEKLSDNLVGIAKTISITANQGVLPKDIDNILAFCINNSYVILDEKVHLNIDDKISSKEKLIYNHLKEWI